MKSNTHLNHHKKNYLIPIIFILIGISCFISYSIIGSDVSPDGMLREPFGLIPVGYLFMFIGILTGIIAFIHSLFIKK